MEIRCEHCGKYKSDHHGPHKNCLHGVEVGKLLGTPGAKLQFDLLTKTYTERKPKMFMHTTPSGKQIPMSMLTDAELKTGIKMFIENIKSNLRIISVKQDQINEASLLLAGLGNVSSLKKDAAYAVEDTMSKLPHYILEAQIRGMDFSKELQECFQRVSKLDFLDNIKQLGNGDDEKSK